MPPQPPQWLIRVIALVKALCSHGNPKGTVNSPTGKLGEATLSVHLGVFEGGCHHSDGLCLRWPGLRILTNQPVDVSEGVDALITEQPPKLLHEPGSLMEAPPCLSTSFNFRAFVHFYLEAPRHGNASRQIVLGMELAWSRMPVGHRGGISLVDFCSASCVSQPVGAA